jgi:HK97 family phage portal protein
MIHLAIDAAARRLAMPSQQRAVPTPRGGARELPTIGADATQLLNAYRGWVHKAVNVISNRIAEIDFKLNVVQPFTDAEEERTSLGLHPLYRLLGAGGGRQPNKLTTSFNFRKLTSIDLELVGNAFWWVEQETGTQPTALWRLRPDRMAPIINRNDGELLGWGYGTGGVGSSAGAATFLPEEVVHFKFPSPIKDPYLGMGTLRAAVYAVDIEEGNKRFQHQFFERGAQLSILLSTEAQMDETEMNLILDQFEERHAGADRAWQPAILTGGMKATPVSSNNKEIEALGLMAFTADDILSTFGVPKTKLGLGEKINRANADAMDVSFNRETINPRLRNMEEQMEASLLPFYPQPVEPRRLEIDFDNPVPSDREFDLEETRTLTDGGLLTVNEARQRHGLAPFDDVFGAKVMLPSMVTMVDPTLDPSVPPDDEGDGAPRALEEGIVIAEAMKAEVRDRFATALATLRDRDIMLPWHSQEGRAAHWRRFAVAAERWEAIVFRQVRRVFALQGQRMVHDINGLTQQGITLTVENVTDVIRVHTIGAHSLRELMATMAAVYERIFRVEAVAAFDATVAALPRAERLPPGTPDEVFSWRAAAMKHLRRRRNRIADMTDTRFREMVKLVEKGMLSPKFEGGSAGVAKLLKKAFRMDARRAETIARTEVGSAANQAAHDGLLAGGAPYKGWLSAQDDRVRDTHAAIDGQVVHVLETFSNGLMQPGDSSGRPEEVVNCRCTVVPEFEAPPV